MSRTRWANLLLVSATFLCISVFSPGPSRAAPSGGQPPFSETGAALSRTPGPRLERQWGQLPLYFVENRGQLDERVAYYLEGSDKTLYFTSSGVTFALTPPGPTKDDRPAAKRSAAKIAATYPSPPAELQRWIVKLDFVGANPNVRPVGEDRTAAVVSYLKGSPDEWTTGLSTYRRIVYHDLWPGIDLAYYGTVNQMKYEFIVRPGADPARIRLAYRGAQVSLNAEGQLLVTTPGGSFSDDTPVAYQEIGGQRVPVSVAYAHDAAADGSATAPEHAAGHWQDYTFALGPYNPDQPLILDPAVIVYCGYVGGKVQESGGDIAVDGMGNAYITGWAMSDETSFPVTVGPDLTYNGGHMDAFVVKVDATGAGLVYAGYIGGKGHDEGAGIAVDAQGNAYVTGVTEAGDGFPVTGGPDLTYNGSGDAFVVKINPAGTGLVYAGYIGGTDIDLGTDIAVDAAGNAYLTGWTRDYSATFPATVGPDLTFNGGEDYGDAFVAKVNATGSGLVYAGYIGGNGDDYGDDIAVDAVGGAYVTGLTSSTEASFPVKVGPLYTYRGAGDAFVAKVSPAGSELVYAGYIGGTGRDEGTGIAVDADGSAFVTGRTASDEVSFPVTSGPDLTYNGNGDAFVVKVNPVGSGMNYGGYIGGSALDVAWDIAVDGAGNAFVTGYTDSDQGTFPVKDGPDLTYNGDDDGFVAMVNATGFDLVYAGYIGGWGWEYGTGIAVDGAGDAYIMGHTDSSEFSFPVTVGPGLHMQALQMAFVAKVATPRFTVSGRVTDADGDPIAGVRVGADAGLAGITDAGGYYTIAVVPTGTYVLTPRLSRYFFSPATRTVSVPPDATGQGFTGTMAPQGVWLPLICR